MVKLTRSLSISILALAIMIGVPIANASAQPLPRIELKSVSSGECMTAYLNTAKAGTAVGTNTCSSTNLGQQFYEESGSLFLRNNLCVSEVANRAVLENCNSTDLKFKYLNSKATVEAFYFGSDSYLTAPAVSKGFMQLTVKTTATVSTAQEFDIITIK